MEPDKTAKTRESTHPQENANIFSNLFFCWTIPTFIKGYKKPLDENDIHGCLKDHDSHILGIKLETAWIQQKSRNKPSLTRAIWKVFGKEIFCYGILLFVIEFGVKLAHPFCLGQLMQYYSQHQTSVTKQEATIYGSLIVLLSFAGVFLGHNYAMGTQHLGMKIRVACSTLIYRKSLRLSKSATADVNSGKLINMLSNDLGRFDNLFLSFHNIWAAPIQIAVVTGLVYYMMDVYALAGICFFVLFVPCQIFLGKKTFAYRLKIAVRTDERMRLMKEIIKGIQIIKMYTWEKPFALLAEKTRNLEIKQIRLTSMVRAINASVSMFLNRTALYFAILAYTLAGNTPEAYYVFVVSSFYNVLRQPLVFHIPHAISSLSESSVSIKRIEAILMLEEVPHISNMVDDGSKTTGIFLHNVSAQWDSSRGKVLSDVNFSAKKNELIGVVGPVGSGKSSIFQIILKELPVNKGILDICGTVSYASQEPWLFSGTIRENILFGEKMNGNRYKEVCRVCALENDFLTLPNGDETIVGERGITLSGGQKARVNLARAVYKDSDIYLLDDPLSSVDMHVGQHLFSKCILEFLKGKCVVLITHQVQYLRNMHRIYLIKNGIVECCNTFEQFESEHRDMIPIIDYEEKYCDDEKENTTLTAIETKKRKTEAIEHKQIGAVRRNVYRKYIREGGNMCVAVLVAFLFVLAQFVASSTDYFLTYWLNLEDAKLNETLEKTDNIFANRENCIIYLYSSLISSVLLVTVIRSTSLMHFCMKSSKKLYHKMSSSVIDTDMGFFYANPAGRILNRFSKDIGIVDEILPLVILETLQALFAVTAITILVAIVIPWILIPSVVILAIFYWLKIFFIASSQNIKRIEAAARSPVYSFLSDSMQGLATVRALNAQDFLVQEFETKQNIHSSAFYLFMACNRTFGFWLDLNCTVYIGIVILSLLLMLDETTGGNVGLAITQSLSLTGMLQWGIRQWSELENQMTAVERVIEYTELKPETSDDNNNQTTINNWPKSGCIQFENVSLRYSPNEPFIINNINIKIIAKERIGIVGRTGAGKSSLIAALFHLVTTEGTILIDGIDTKTLPLHLLRSKLSIIPQEPVLLHGPLRRNLDPFDVYSDEQLWAALKEVKLDTVVEELPGGLYSKVTDDGSNFSVGQKQLLCVARALIRKNKILILDEATSSVDPETDALIQNTIRKKFGDCTVLAIAHRIRSVIDSDKILVIEEGSVIEYDHPYNLLKRKTSKFYELLTKTEDSEFSELIKIAEEAYKKNYMIKI